MPPFPLSNRGRASQFSAQVEVDQPPESPAPLFRRPARAFPRPEPAHDMSALAHLGIGGAEGDIATLEAAIHPAACIRLPLRVFQGPGGLMADALGDLAALHEPRFYAESSIQTETFSKELCHEAAEAQSGLHSDTGHFVVARGSLIGRHESHGWLGAPQGQEVRLRGMADLWCAQGQVRDAWILRDTAGALAQAGTVTPQQWARARIRAAGGPELCDQPLSPDTDLEGPYTGRGNSSPHADDLVERLRGLMDGDFLTLGRDRSHPCTHVLPGNRQCIGSSAAQAFWAGLRSALPSAAFRVEHRSASVESGQAPRAAVRWSLYGRHDGAGRFGPATGVYLHVMGMTHVEFGPTGIRRDWTLIDDCAIWTQILLATGDI
ncbi:ester cyclase [Rhodobacteraceae bacterium SC52]|nr:ester cyclase [Rhodobacteraceae bacterium SC52]